MFLELIVICVTFLTQNSKKSVFSSKKGLFRPKNQQKPTENNKKVPFFQLFVSLLKPRIDTLCHFFDTTHITIKILCHFFDTTTIENCHVFSIKYACI